jgi:predicted metal-dependent peptidase
MHMPAPPTMRKLGCPYEIFTAGRLLAKQAAPYFVALLYSLVPRETVGLGTVGVTERMLMFWDPRYVECLTPKQMAGLWVHEILHIWLKHPQRRGTRDPFLWNLAGDIYINFVVLEMGLELPPGGVGHEMFGFPPGLTADEYYHLLVQEADKQQGQGGQGGQGGEPGDDQDQQGQGGAQGGPQQPGDQEGGSGGPEGQDGSTGQPGAKQGVSKGGPPGSGIGRGLCGGCAGHKLQGEPDDGPGGQGRDPDERTEGEVERVRRVAAEAIREDAKKARGKVPASLSRLVDELFAPAQVPWPTKLRRACRHAVGWRAGAVDYRYDGPSRRQAGIGYGAGKPVLPRMRTPVPRVEIDVDTSGSMGQRQLRTGLIEVNGVLKALDAEITICAIDCAIHEVGTVKTVQEAAALLKGGGGTDFRPAFDRIAKLPKDKRPEVVIFITDGMGPAPKVAPSGIKVIWLLVGPYKQAPCAWGEQIEIDDAA